MDPPNLSISKLNLGILIILLIFFILNIFYFSSLLNDYNEDPDSSSFLNSKTTYIVIIILNVLMFLLSIYLYCYYEVGKYTKESNEYIENIKKELEAVATAPDPIDNTKLKAIQQKYEAKDEGISYNKAYVSLIEEYKTQIDKAKYDTTASVSLPDYLKPDQLPKLEARGFEIPKTPVPLFFHSSL